MCRAFPGPEYYGGSAPPGPLSGRRAYPGQRAGCPPPGTSTGRFPCSLSFARRSRSPAIPLRHRCGYAADLPAASLAAHAHRPGSSPPLAAGAHRFQPRSARFGLAPDQGAVTHRFLAYSFPSRSPDPHHLAVLTRPGLSGLLPPSPAPPGSGCPQLHRPAATGTAVKVSHLHSNHSASRRTHDLRHFYASTLIAANLNPKVIQARLGHATITETMDTYGHLFPDADDLGRGAIDVIFAAARTEQERNQKVR